MSYVIKSWCESILFVYHSNFILMKGLQATPKDIEELAELGRTADTCPYFGSRSAIAQAQVDHISVHPCLTDIANLQPPPAEEHQGGTGYRPQGPGPCHRRSSQSVFPP
jgi:hypothetical protein